MNVAQRIFIFGENWTQNEGGNTVLIHYKIRLTELVDLIIILGKR